MAGNAEIVAELESIAEEYEQQDQQTEGPQPAATMQERLNQMPGEELAGQFLNISFGLAEKIRGPHWSADPVLLSEAAREYGALIDQYGGRITLPPWAGVAVITGLLLAKPVMGEVALKKAREEAEAQKQQAEQNESEKGTDYADKSE